MKAMMMKGVAAVLSPVDAALPPSRNVLRSLLQGRKPTGSPATRQLETEASDLNALEPSIYRFVLGHSLPQQLILILFTLISFPFLYFSLDLPKTIINRAIGGRQFPQTILGIPFDQTSYLLILCSVFLTLVFINGGFKYCINTLKGRLGERMLRRFRYQLYHRMLRFPISQFNKTSAAQIIPMITAECESLGGFIGDAFVTPAFQGGTLLTIVFFMFMQDPVLGAAAVALYPVQGYVIPKLQRKVNQLGKQRVRTVREVADRVHESAAGIIDIHANDAAKLQLTTFAHLLGKIYDIRFEIYRRKFFVKFLNNFIAQLTPFFFYSIGGYLVIRGNLSFGALVAVLAAYKDLASPWKELLDFYQIKEDSRIKYEQIVEQFQPAGMIDARLQMDEPKSIPHLSGELSTVNLSYAEEDGSCALDGVSFTVSLSEHVAVIGQGASGKNELALLLARLITPTGGRIQIGGFDLATLPAAVIGRRIGYVGAAPYLFAGTLRDNLLFGLRHTPQRPADDSGGISAKRQARRAYEARRSGNIDFDLHADWIDYKAAGVENIEALSRRITEVLVRLDLDEAIYWLGLRWRLDPEAHPDAEMRLLEARKALACRLAAEGITNLVETYDPEKFNLNASVAENLLFGTPIGPVFDYEALANNAYILQVLRKVGLTEDLIAAGRQVAETMIELFADLPPDHEFFEQFSFIGAGDLPDFAAILGRIGNGGTAALSNQDRTKLLSLPFKLIPARHRLDVLDEPMQRRILEARKMVRADLPPAARQQIEFFDPDRYNAAASVQDNILFGKIAYGEADAPVRIPEVLGEVIDGLSLRQVIIGVGLDYHVGTGGGGGGGAPPPSPRPARRAAHGRATPEGRDRPGCA
jgi:putative ABC transport system ATP-binding protein